MRRAIVDGKRKRFFIRREQLMSGEKRRPRGRTIAMILGSLAVVALVCGAAWFFRPKPSGAVDANWAALPVGEELMVAQVAASGVIAPEQQATLSFATSGLVKEVLVEVGDEVSATEVLARLEADDLELELARAQASLDQSVASSERTRAGATPAEIAAAEAQVASASGSLQQTLGNVTQADIDSARFSPPPVGIITASSTPSMDCACSMASSLRPSSASLSKAELGAAIGLPLKARGSLLAGRCDGR